MIERPFHKGANPAASFPVFVAEPKLSANLVAECSSAIFRIYMCLIRQQACVDVLSQPDGEGALSAVDAFEDVANLELHMEDMTTAGELVHTLNHFYIADKELFMRAQDPTVSFTELLLGDAATGFSLDHEALSQSYEPVDPTNVPMGGLGAAAGDSFDVQSLVRNALRS